MTKRRFRCGVLALVTLLGCDADSEADTSEAGIVGQSAVEAGSCSSSTSVSDAGASEPTNSASSDAASDTSRTGRPSDAGTTTDASGATRQDSGSGSSPRDAGPVAGGDSGAPVTPDASSGPNQGLWKPKPGASWQWDLSGTITKFDVAAEVYDIDGFENDAAQVKRLHDLGKKVICYISVGTYEPARPDAKDFPKEVLGKYWPEWGETYIDIRSEGVRNVMKKRLDMCKSKGFDGIEPDNMDMFEGGQSDTGFPLTEADGIAYAKWLAAEAHARGLSIGQKNASSITADIEASYDWALTEDCFADGWCDDMKAYTAHDKAMFMCEYTDTKVDFAAACKAGKALKFSPILKARDLTPPVEFCK